MRTLTMLPIAATLVLASAGAHADDFQTGSLIIPMDTSYQDEGMFLAYGLVYELLRSGVPVRWVIQPGKAFGAADFVASAEDHLDGTPIASHGYRGGPWVVDSADAAAALPIVDAWQAAHPTTAVHEVTAPFSGVVAKRLVAAPKIAMFADGNQDIARRYLQAAAIPDSTLDPAWPDTSPDMLSVADVEGPTDTDHEDGALFDADGAPAYCQFMSMHWGVNDAEAHPEVVAEVRSFLRYSTHFFAECQAVNAFENLSPWGFFLTPNGYLIEGRPNAVDHHHHDSPFAQIDGAFATQGGSEPAYSLPPGDQYKAGGVTMITAQGYAEGQWDLWMTGYLDGECPPEVEICNGLGKVSYLGGHDYDVTVPLSTHPGSQGTRLFLNSLFDSACATAGGQPAIVLTKSAPATTTSPSLTFTIDFDNGGPSVALDAILTDVVPVGTEFVSATAGGEHANGTVSWQLGNLGVGEGGTVSFTVNLLAYGEYENTASLYYKVGLTERSLDSNTTETIYGEGGFGGAGGAGGEGTAAGGAGTGAGGAGGSGTGAIDTGGDGAGATGASGEGAGAASGQPLAPEEEGGCGCRLGGIRRVGAERPWSPTSWWTMVGTLGAMASLRRRRSPPRALP